MKKLLLLILALLLSSCGILTTNTIKKETFLDPSGRPERIVVTQELSDDGLYYVQATEAEQAQAKAMECPGCTPGERIGLAAIQALGKRPYVARGKNFIEGGVELGESVLSRTPLFWAIDKLGDAANKPNSVKMEGENMTYAPSEYHFTGLKMNDNNQITVPYRFNSDDDSSVANGEM